MINFKNILNKMLPGKRLMRKGAILGMCLVAVAIFVVVNLFAGELEWKLDLTPNKIFSVSQETINYLKTINKDIEIIVFSKTEVRRDIKNVLDDYKKYYPKLKLTYVDPDKNPGLVKKYLSSNTNLSESNQPIVVKSGEKWRALDLYEFYSSDYQTGANFSKVEQKITGAISYAVETKESTVYFLNGHGEIDVDTLSTVKSSLEDLSYIIKGLNLISSPDVPKDAGLLIIAAPTKDIGQDEKVKIDNYLAGGGKLMVFLEPGEDLPNVFGVLKPYSISVDNDIVIEQELSGTVFNHPLYLKPQIQPTDITSSIISKNLNIIFPGSRSLRTITDGNPDVKVQSLAKSSAKSWGETNFNKQPSKDASDIPGPFDLAFSAEKPNPTNKEQVSRLVVFGSSNFITEQAVQTLGAVGNSDLFINSVTWLGERKDTVVISSKSIQSDRINPTKSQVITALVIIGALPLIIAALGIVIWLRRRHL